MLHLLSYKSVAPFVLPVDFLAGIVKQATTLRNPQGNKLPVDSI